MVFLAALASCTGVCGQAADYQVDNLCVYNGANILSPFATTIAVEEISAALREVGHEYRTKGIYRVYTYNSEDSEWGRVCHGGPFSPDLVYGCSNAWSIIHIRDKGGKDRQDAVVTLIHELGHIWANRVAGLGSQRDHETKWLWEQLDDRKPSI